MKHGLKYIAFYVQKHITPCSVVITSLLVCNKPLEAPASVKLVNCGSDNSLMPDSTESLPETILTYHQLALAHYKHISMKFQSKLQTISFKNWTLMCRYYQKESKDDIL